MKKKIYEMSAAKDEKDNYRHFGIHKMTASLYGDKVEDIIKVKFEIHNDQSLPNEKEKYAEPDYWGWIDTGKDEFSMMIYQQRFLLNMCFPAGIKGSEEAGHGKAYRLRILD